MDGMVHTAAALQRLIRGVHDALCPHLGNVAARALNADFRAARQQQRANGFAICAQGTKLLQICLVPGLQFLRMVLARFVIILPGVLIHGGHGCSQRQAGG
eukprot:5719000-Heterocapsa_arctica.AAC.1